MGKSISGRQLAKLLDISHTMVRKYVKRGMPTSSASAALAWLGKNSGGRFSEESAAADAPEESEESEVPVKSTVRMRPPTSATEGDELDNLSQAALTKRYTAARIKLTERDTEIRRLKGLQGQMDADLRDGKLLRAETEAKKSSELAIALRNRLIALATEWALQLAAMSDPAIVADFTRKRIKAALTEFCAAYGVTVESQ